MHHKNNQHHKQLTELTRILSMYHALTYKQIYNLYPDIPASKVLSLINNLVKSGRLFCRPELELVLCSKDAVANPSIISAFWVLLDFQSEITYHTVSDFPITMTFCTDSDVYDIIHISPDKETLMNHALSQVNADTPHRLVIVDRPEQIPLLTFPGITAFCTTTTDGKVQYYKKQE